VSPQLAEALLLRHYAIAGKAASLSGERDHNFLLRSARGATYVLKISHPAESLQAVEQQRRALAHIAAVDPELPVPAVIPDVEGASQREVDVGGCSRIVRVLSYVHGTMLYRTEPSPRQDRSLGAFLARLGLALEGLPLVQGDAGLLWDLQRLGDSRTLTAGIEDRALRSLVENAYDQFEQHARETLASLPRQAIHNDMNPYNVVMDAQDSTRIAGIIDFGDMVRAPLAADAAVGAAYRWTLREHPLAGLSRFLQGYASRRPIEDSELGIMFDLVRARLALTINITHWQSRQLAGNRDYVMRLQDQLAQALNHISQVTRSEAQRYIGAALTQGLGA
jgi:Ser/Thr protein kinase RdoA (MazF antagonist)